MQKIQEKIFILFFIIVGLAIAYSLGPILTPFLAGALLAYLANPLVNKLKTRLRLPRVISVVIVFMLFLFIIVALVLLLIPLIGKQINTLLDTLPTILVWIQEKVVPLLKDFGVDDSLINADGLKTVLMENWAKAGGAADWLLKATFHSSMRMIEVIMNLILIPVVTFYLLCDWNEVVKGVRNLIPRRIEPTVVELVSEGDEVLTAFFRGQLLVMLSLAVIFSIGLTAVGLKTGILIGLIAGILSIVPYLGFTVGIIIASLAAFVQTNSFLTVGLVIIIFLLGQIIDHVYLTPKLVGDRIGLHPVAVIFAILAGGHLFGFFGILLALPTAALIMVWLRYLHKRYHNSRFYHT